MHINPFGIIFPINNYQVVPDWFAQVLNLMRDNNKQPLTNNEKEERHLLLQDLFDKCCDIESYVDVRSWNILDYALYHYDLDMAKQLIALGMPINDQQLKDVDLQFYLFELVGRQNYSKIDILVLCNLIMKDKLPAITDDGNIVLLRLLRLLSSASQHTREIIKDHFHLTEEDILALQEWQDQLELFLETEDLCVKIKLHSYLNKNMGAVEKLSPSMAQQIKAYFHENSRNLTERYLAVQQWAQRNWWDQPGSQLQHEADGKSRTDTQFLKEVVEVSILEGKYENILPALAQMNIFRKIELSKANYHFLLDKTWPFFFDTFTLELLHKNPFGSGQIKNQGLVLADALNAVGYDILANPQELVGKKSKLISICRKLSQAFALCAKWDKDISEHRPFENIAAEIVEIIKNSNRDFPVIIPCGTINHALVVRIEIKEGTARLAIYNSGYGLRKHHEQYKETNHFQTCLKIINVPVEDVCDIQSWVELLAQFNFDNIDGVYHSFKQIGRNGEIFKPFKVGFQFEKEQLRETCTGQALMACFRDIVREEVEAGKVSVKARFKGMGTYKWLKVRTQIVIGTSHCEAIDPKIERLVKKKVTKHTEEISLVHVVKDPVTFEIKWKNALNVLMQMGQSEMVTKLSKVPKFTTSNRYYALLFVQKLIGRLIFNDAENDRNYEKFVRLWIQDLNVAALTLEEKLDNKTRLLQLLNYYASKGQWDHVLPIYVDAYNNHSSKKWLREWILKQNLSQNLYDKLGIQPEPDVNGSASSSLVAMPEAETVLNFYLSQMQFEKAARLFWESYSQPVSQKWALDWIKRTNYSESGELIAENIHLLLEGIGLLSAKDKLDIHKILIESKLDQFISDRQWHFIAENIFESPQDSEMIMQWVASRSLVEQQLILMAMQSMDYALLHNQRSEKENMSVRPRATSSDPERQTWALSVKPFRSH